MIEGLSHITFIVRDLDRMTEFLTRIFDAREVYSSGSQTFSISSEKFFLINGLWIAVMAGESLLSRSYRFAVFIVAQSTMSQDYEGNQV